MSDWDEKKKYFVMMLVVMVVFAFLVWTIINTYEQSFNKKIVQVDKRISILDDNIEEIRGIAPQSSEVIESRLDSMLAQISALNERFDEVEKGKSSQDVKSELSPVLDAIDKLNQRLAQIAEAEKKPCDQSIDVTAYEKVIQRQNELIATYEKLVGQIE